MWFNNAFILNYEYADSALTANNLLEYLESNILKPCPPHARQTSGWAYVNQDNLLQETAGGILISMGKEERLLPRAVIQRILSERMEAYEGMHGTKMKKRERMQLAEELEFELLPKAFCLQKSLSILFDTVHKRLIINTASSNQASQCVNFLRKSIPSLRIEPLPRSENLAGRFKNWIENIGALPNDFQLVSDCVLFLPNHEKKRINCKGYELPSEEILMLLSQGLVAAEISMSWNDRISFTLTHDFTLKRIKCLDYLVEELDELRNLEEENARLDAGLALLAGELRGLTSALLTATA